MTRKVISRRALLKGSAALGAGTALGGIALAQDGAAEAAKASIKNVCGADVLETVFAVDYDDEQWQQLLGGLEDHLNRLRTRRAQSPLANADPPALVFDPRLKGRTYQLQPPVRHTSPILSIEDDVISMPDVDEDIAYAPIFVQSRMLRAGKITSRQLTDLYLDRIAKYAPKLENFVTVTAELARAQADAADRELAAGKDRGPLHGIPYVMKDLADTKGVKTTWGAAPYKDRVAKEDATIVTKLQDAGAVLLGKTTLGALAYGDLWFGGLTRNPWAPEEGSSGSSAGSASATAAGLCSFSIGTETLGSIVSPSTRNGCVGLRPSFGRVSRAGAMALCWSLDKFGPITRTVDDANLVLEAINGFDAKDPSSLDTGYDAKAALDARNAPRQISIGFDPAWFGERARDTDREVLKTLRRLGYKMVEISMPQMPLAPLLTQLEAEAAAAFEDLTTDDKDALMRWQTDNAWPNTFRTARLHSAVELLQVDRLRRKWMEAMAQMYDTVDVIACPNFAGGLLYVTNYTGHPSLTLPLGFEERRLAPRTGQADAKPGPLTRLPHTFTLWGNLFREDQLVSVGSKLEVEFNFSRRRPDETKWT